MTSHAKKRKKAPDLKRPSVACGSALARVWSSERW